MIQTELHRHLDVSVRTATLLRLAQERGLEPQSTSLEAFREKLLLRDPLTSLEAVIEKFDIFRNVLDRPEVLEQVAFEVVEDVRSEGTRQVELRWSPSFVCGLSKLPWNDALDGFEAGIRRALATYPEMRAGMICIVTREYGMNLVDETVEFFLRNTDRFIGIDLAGSEADFPNRKFERAFRPVRDAGAKITVHAGEGTSADAIWEAIELLGARRIGHGIACIQDPELMEYLARERVCLEMCPTSNWLTQCVSSLEDHPIPRVLRSGIPVSINTDDPGVFGVTLPHEIKLCREKMGMSEAEIQLCLRHAQEASFL